MKKSLDQSWIEPLYNRYSGTIVYRCLWLLRNREEAEDATSDTFLRALQHPELNLLPPKHQKNWLFQVATQRCLDKLKRPRIEVPPIEVPEDDTKTLPDERDAHPGADELLIWQEMKEKLALLDERERLALELRFLGEFKLREIAEVLDCAIGTVSNLIESALEALRKLYDDDKN